MMRRLFQRFITRGLQVFVLCYPTCAWQAELPRLLVETKLPDVREATVVLAAGDNFQRALDRASPGDVIALQPGAVFQGPFTLPAKSGTGWVIIRSAAAGESLPQGVRVTPAQARYMPALVSPSAPVISAAPRAHHYRFIGVEFRPAGHAEQGGLLDRVRATITRNTGVADGGIYLKNLIDLGSGVGDRARLPHHIIFDRCYVHGDAHSGGRRGIALNGRYMAVINSWFSDFKEEGADSQAILGWNGSGPFKIVNNHLEGAGENVMFGGAVPAIKGLVPGDIEIRGNHFTKPLSWKTGHPDFAGTPWSVKNLFELKNARRVLVDGNLFEYNWPHAQNGFAILLTVRNESGDVPWATVADVHFTNNVLRHIGAGVNILGRDDNGMPSEGTRDIEIRNNLFSNLGGQWGDGTLLQLLDGVENVVFAQNTAFNSGRIIMSEGRPHRNFVFTGNLVMHNTYGIIGTGTGMGKSTLSRYFPGAVFHDNALVGAPADAYPQNNTFPDVSMLPDVTGSLQGLDNSRQTPPRQHREPSGGIDVQALCAALSVTERSALCDHREDSRQVAD